jgi:hypothetical protein
MALHAMIAAVKIRAPQQDATMQLNWVKIVGAVSLLAFTLELFVKITLQHPVVALSLRAVKGLYLT